MKKIIPLLLLASFGRAAMFGGSAPSGGTSYNIFPASATIISPQGINIGGASVNSTTLTDNALVDINYPAANGSPTVLYGVRSVGSFSGSNMPIYGMYSDVTGGSGGSAVSYGVYGLSRSQGVTAPTSGAGIFGEMATNDINGVGIRGHAACNKSAGGGTSNYGGYFVADSAGTSNQINYGVWSSASGATGIGNYGLWINAGDFHFPQSTLAALQARAPNNAGDGIYCTTCVATAVCVSTGTGVGAWASAVSKTTACN